MNRRDLLKAAASCCAIALPSITPAWAGSFPDRQIRILLGYPAGGTTDVILRRIVQAASKHLGQSIIIENRPGAGSTISLLATKHAPADGYTLSISTVAAFTTPIQVESAYDPLRDTTYIVGLTNVTYGVLVNANSSFKTFADLVQYAKENPGKVTYGAPAGPGNTGHQAMIAISEKEKLDMNLIPYKGSADLQPALLGNHITFAMDGSGAFNPMVQANKERLLAVATENRMPLYPDVPSLKELGYAVSFDSPWGLVGPPKMDPKVVNVLHDAFKKALEDPEVRATIFAAGQVERYMSPDDYQRYAVKENEYQIGILNKLGLARKR